MKRYICAVTAVFAAQTAQAEVFNGPYVAVQAGIEQGKVDSVALYQAEALQSGGGILSTDRNKATGGTIGISLGYDARVFANMVAGVEVAGNYSSARNRQIITDASDPTFPITAVHKSNLTYEVTARVGVLVTPKILLYARGGYAMSTLKTVLSAQSSTDELRSLSTNGWIAGIGAEYALSEKLSTKIELRHMGLKNASSRNQVQLGVGYHF
jgi:outer membrane immunogenic protein